MMSSGINLVMTVIGFAVSTMFIVFVCTRLICARIQLYASRRAFPTSSRSDLSRLERGIHGLEHLVITNFPTKKYSDVFFSSSEDAQSSRLIYKVPMLVHCSSALTFFLLWGLIFSSIPLPIYLTIWCFKFCGWCTVCLGEYHKEDILRILPFCGHSFHAACIDKWLQQHSTCPVCRISLREFPEKKCMPPMFSSAIQSHYGMESLDTNTCHCLSANPGLSSRLLDDHRMDPIQESPFAAQNCGFEAGESNSISIEGSQTVKDSGNKLVESPSNT